MLSYPQGATATLLLVALRLARVGVVRVVLQLVEENVCVTLSHIVECDLRDLAAGSVVPAAARVLRVNTRLRQQKKSHE